MLFVWLIHDSNMFCSNFILVSDSNFVSSASLKVILLGRQQQQNRIGSKNKEEKGNKNRISFIRVTKWNALNAFKFCKIRVKYRNVALAKLHERFSYRTNYRIAYCV